jgi:hypothetical protein
MNSVIFAGLSLGKENQISTPFKKWIKAEFIFHFFHFFFHIFPHRLNGGENIYPSGQEKCVYFQVISQ